MSIIFESSNGFVVCHEKFLKDMCSLVEKEGEMLQLKPHENMFHVVSPYVRDAEALRKVNFASCLEEAPSSRQRNQSSRKRKINQCETRNVTSDKIETIKNTANELLKEARCNGNFHYIPADEDLRGNNKHARHLSQRFYQASQDWIQAPFDGGNNSEVPTIKTIGLESFIIPEKCRFYCRDVFELKNYLDELGRFDFIVVDPPWWNKYIRRKKAKCSAEGYNMIHNKNLKELPFKQLLAPEGIIAVWCTNADSHLDELRDQLFPAWNVKKIANWTWLKVTRSGDPVCPFSLPPGKQPFEQLIIGVSLNHSGSNLIPKDGKVVMSIPSAVHSHKPPLIDLFKPYLPAKPRCLEVFARYLLPHWTSWGLEVIKLMSESLFTEKHSHKEGSEVGTSDSLT